MKKKNIINCFTVLFLCTCMLISMIGDSALAENQIPDAEEITEALPEVSDESLTDTSNPDNPPIEEPNPETPEENTEENTEEKEYCEKCGTSLSEDGVCPLCEAVSSDSENNDNFNDTDSLKDPDAPDETVYDENSDASENAVGSPPAVTSEDTNESEPANSPDNIENENEAGRDEQEDDESGNENNNEEETAPAVQNAPTYFISIPVTVCRISPDEKTALLTIDVNCVDGFKDGDRLDLSFSSANDMILICDNLDSIDYILRDTNGEPALNHATVASFSENGSAELSVEIAGEPSYAGEYRDVLTFTATFIPGAEEQS